MAPLRRRLTRFVDRVVGDAESEQERTRRLRRERLEDAAQAAGMAPPADTDVPFQDGPAGAAVRQAAFDTLVATRRHAALGVARRTAQVASEQLIQRTRARVGARRSALAPTRERMVAHVRLLQSQQARLAELDRRRELLQTELQSRRRVVGLMGGLAPEDASRQNALENLATALANATYQASQGRLLNAYGIARDALSAMVGAVPFYLQDTYLALARQLLVPRQRQELQRSREPTQRLVAYHRALMEEVRPAELVAANATTIANTLRGALMEFTTDSTARLGRGTVRLPAAISPQEAVEEMRGSIKTQLDMLSREIAEEDDEEKIAALSALLEALPDSFGGGMYKPPPPPPPPPGASGAAVGA